MTKKSEKPAFTIDIFEPVATRLTVTHPVTGEPVPSLWVECVGPESEQYRTVIRKIARQRLSRKPFEDEVDEAEYQADLSLQILAACVIAWNEDGFGEFDKDRIKDVFKKYPSLMRQIDNYVAEKKNFFRISGNLPPEVS